MPSNLNQEARLERVCLSAQEQTHENGPCDQHQPKMVLYYQRGEGTGNVFRFRVGPDYYWIAGSGPGGSLTPSEEEYFYRAMERAGVQREE
ncbi:hypothetical protein V8C42DRAFT_24506 [Trichoderma barbatum]